MSKPVREIVTLELEPDEADAVFAACRQYEFPETGEGVASLLLALLAGSDPRTAGMEGGGTAEAIAEFLANPANREMMGSAARAGLSALLKAVRR